MKIRASQIGRIMSEPRSKSEVLSQTAKSYIEELVLEDVYGIRKDFTSRYTDKGNMVEDESIQLAADVLDLEFIVKNEEYFENDFIKGTPDVITSKFVLDVKSSYSANTFPFFQSEIPNKDYLYQLQGYMWLTGVDNAILAYCLTNTPDVILNDEVRRLIWKLDTDPQFADMDSLEKESYAWEEVLAVHNIDRIEKKNRVKAFLIEKDEAVIEKIKEKVYICREYYNQLVNNLNK